jgi:hypothetical protein
MEIKRNASLNPSITLSSQPARPEKSEPTTSSHTDSVTLGESGTSPTLPDVLLGMGSLKSGVLAGMATGLKREQEENPQPSVFAGLTAKSPQSQSYDGYFIA